ncbi:protein FAR-RED IMPAIRED RESPONSE 1-like [Camellia sinensis]|uniref:protein FAR-RED IMPAIRED RESPONSE 1-like n=1 Tax=Camellia sinensis TaxID=4442 RepID=UPI0010355F29|nr:protein FAR-RED IMPAIRED RESPONSE 1-like [Camellia sinensis]
MNKRIRTPVKRKLEINNEARIWVSRNFHSIVVETEGYEALTFDERDARNHIENARRLRLRVGDAESVGFYFHRMQQENSNFYSAIDFDVDGRIRNLFWADARSRAAYKAFGDVVSFDTTYLTNKYDMPFALFVGVNHHGQSILFGCGLLCNENMETFVWLFKEWLNCMSATPPKAIITDQCRAMQNVIEIVFPQARHRWCLWYIMKKIPEKLRGYSQYEAIKFALQNIVYDSFRKDEFDEEWQTMIEKFSLHDNEWLGYNNALRSKVEKETKADFESRNKLYDSLTVYEFEKQFHATYTNAKFKEVQNEGSICTYHVKEAVLVGEKMKKVEFLVYFNSTEFEMLCVCRWFEFRGIMCAHSLSVLIERCIYEVTDQYIMPRWRKDLERGYTCIPTTYMKSGAALNAKVHDNYHKTLDEIIDIASNDDGKHKAIQLGLREIKERVRKDESACASNVPPSSSTVPPFSTNVPPSSTTHKGRKMGQCEPRKLNFGYTDGMKDNAYDLVIFHFEQVLSSSVYFEQVIFDSKQILNRFCQVLYILNSKAPLLITIGAIQNDRSIKQQLHVLPLQCVVTVSTYKEVSFLCVLSKMVEFGLQMGLDFDLSTEMTVKHKCLKITFCAESLKLSPISSDKSVAAGIIRFTMATGSKVAVRMDMLQRQ